LRTAQFRDGIPVAPIRSRARNVAVIGRERSLRFPEVTPTVLVQPSPAQVHTSGVNFNLPSGEMLKEQIMNRIKNFLKDESGIETLEYAVIGAIVVVVAVLIYGSGWGQAVKTTLVRAASQSTAGVTT
jgi:Flp pilus assembly pilin Flp